MEGLGFGPPASTRVPSGIDAELADLYHARAKDKLSGKDFSLIFLEELLADPMAQLVMKAEGVFDAHLRHLYSGSKNADRSQSP